jgi:hypothetical protein
VIVLMGGLLLGAQANGVAVQSYDRVQVAIRASVSPRGLASESGRMIETSDVREVVT